MLILGVDPGALRGAYAVLDASGSLLEVADLPKVADHKTRWVDAPVLLSRLLEIKPVANFDVAFLLPSQPPVTLGERGDFASGIKSPRAPAA
jgi:hypothetical protein